MNTARIIMHDPRNGIDLTKKIKELSDKEKALHGSDYVIKDPINVVRIETSMNEDKNLPEVMIVDHDGKIRYGWMDIDQIGRDDFTVEFQNTRPGNYFLDALMNFSAEELAAAACLARKPNSKYYYIINQALGLKDEIKELEVFVKNSIFSEKPYVKE